MFMYCLQAAEQNYSVKTAHKSFKNVKVDNEWEQEQVEKEEK
jgi:hypothetical protein